MSRRKQETREIQQFKRNIDQVCHFINISRGEASGKSTDCKRFLIISPENYKSDTKLIIAGMKKNVNIVMPLRGWQKHQDCMVWFGLVLWHINHCRLFDAKSILYA